MCQSVTIYTRHCLWMGLGLQTLTKEVPSAGYLCSSLTLQCLHVTPRILQSLAFNKEVIVYGWSPQIELCSKLPIERDHQIMNIVWKNVYVNVITGLISDQIIWCNRVKNCMIHKNIAAHITYKCRNLSYLCVDTIHHLGTWHTVL